MRNRWKIGVREKEILKMIGSIFEIASMIVDPKTGNMWKRTLSVKNKNYRRILEKLEEKELIILGGERIELSARGKELIRKIEVEEIELVKESWDGVWRVVVYDIPNEFNRERDYYRAILKRMGFLKIQKSMWIVPWECKEEIAIIAQSLGLAPYVVYLTTDHLPNQGEFEKRFELIRSKM